jgi:hypothetical protein
MAHYHRTIDLAPNVRDIEMNILILHGMDDKNIPVIHSRKLFSVMTGNNTVKNTIGIKKLVEVPNAAYGDVHQTFLWRYEIMNFIANVEKLAEGKLEGFLN